MSFTEKIEALEIKKSIKTYNKERRTGVTIMRNGKNAYLVSFTSSGYVQSSMYVSRFEEGNSIIGMYVGDIYVGYISKMMAGIE